MAAMVSASRGTRLRSDAPALLALLGLALSAACQTGASPARDAGNGGAGGWASGGAGGWEMLIPPGGPGYAAVSLGPPGTVYALTNSNNPIHSVTSSHDDGKTWTTVDLTDTSAPILSVAAFGATGVLAVGYTNDTTLDPPPLVARSMDGGATFTLLHPTTFKGLFTFVTADGAGNAIGVGEASAGGFFVRSSDGGDSWSQVPVPGTAALWSVWTTASGTLYACGQAAIPAADGGTDAGAADASTDAAAAGPYAEITGVIVRSDDGGATWTIVARSPSALFSISGTPDGQRIMAVGFAFNQVESIDGGATWRVECGRNDTTIRDSDFASVWVPDAQSAPFIAANAPYVVRNLNCDYTGTPLGEGWEQLPTPTVGLVSDALGVAGNATEVWAVGLGIFRRRYP
jgi:hypothetical protein